MASSYDYWRRELKTPGSQPRDTAEPIWGRWRIVGARTGHDTPFAVWGDESGSLFKIGRKDAIPSTSPEAMQFMAMSFPHAVAVTEEDYKAALVDGIWPDGKPSRKPEAIVDERPKEGQSNYAPANEVIAERIEQLLEKIKEIQPINSQERADKANELGQKLKAAVAEGTAAREAARLPAVEALAEVDKKWVAVGAGDETLVLLRKSVREWLKAEEARIAAEARAAAAAAEKAGLPPPLPDPPKVAAKSTYGRTTTLRTVKRGQITNIDKFFYQVKDQTDVIEFMQKKANAFARNSVEVEGMKIVEDRA